MKKLSWIAMFLVVVCVFSGCEKTVSDWKDKFVRKKKPQQKTTRFYKGESYRQEYPNATLYENHYIYWKRWEEELIEALKGDNIVRQQGYLDHSIEEMLSMREYLTDDKKPAFDKYISELQKYQTQIKNGKGGGSNMRTQIRYDISKHFRSVMREFSPDEIEAYIKEDVIPDLSEESSQPDESQESDYTEQSDELAQDDTSKSQG